METSNSLTQTPRDNGVIQRLTDLASQLRTLVRDLHAEVARLNRAGVPADALIGRTRRERARVVKSAFAGRHNGHNHCC